ncbi:MAG: ABC transporter ATP-binding protein [Cyanobacteria bacterium CRU_2_1]|nr:ABC transporter ATP-binding protein [Cyanobacteria bacterium RU_5_0]NJR60185.1 ABC transporter ATP-binding protein [Cyanobacteria bacterium CRU_2_1]
MVKIPEYEVITPSLQPLGDNVLLSVQGVSKKFCRSLKRSLFYGLQDIATELTGSRRRSAKLRSKEFWALKDVSLELRRGEALGLIGVNGSGKTTLLRIISGLIKPDTGSIRIRGRVAPLIALGAGFSPVLTGRENIYANMSILGLTTREIDRRFDEVVEFAEIGEAIDAPVQSYSSGMAARLGFSCAIHTDPDILLIDEVLAVGDVKFRSKCERKLGELRKQGTSFVLVSHAFQGILNVCDTAAYLSKGHLIASGDANSILAQYEQDLFSIKSDRSSIPFVLPEKPAAESAGADLISVYFRDSQGKLIESPISGESTYFCVKCRAVRKINTLSLFLAIYQPTRDNCLALHMSSAYDRETFEVLPGEHELRVYMPCLGLLPSSYTMNVYIKDGSLYTMDAHESIRFTVQGNDKLNRGMFYQQREWQVLQSPPF